MTLQIFFELSLEPCRSAQEPSHIRKPRIGRGTAPALAIGSQIVANANSIQTTGRFPGFAEFTTPQHPSATFCARARVARHPTWVGVACKWRFFSALRVSALEKRGTPLPVRLDAGSRISCLHSSCLVLGSLSTLLWHFAHVRSPFAHMQNKDRDIIFASRAQHSDTLPVPFLRRSMFRAQSMAMFGDAGITEVCGSAVESISKQPWQVYAMRCAATRRQGRKRALLLNQTHASPQRRQEKKI
jgi:hypothetical protein